MNHLAKIICLVALAAPSFAATFQTDGVNSVAWSKILGAVGIEHTSTDPTILIAGVSAPAATAVLAGCRNFRNG